MHIERASKLMAALLLVAAGGIVVAAILQSSEVVGAPIAACGIVFLLLFAALSFGRIFMSITPEDVIDEAKLLGWTVARTPAGDWTLLDPQGAAVDVCSAASEAEAWEAFFMGTKGGA